MARCRFAVASLVLALVLALGLPAAAEPAAYPYQVTSTADSGPSTLRAAIEAANATPGVPDTIRFAIGSCAPGICTIVLQSDLPALSDPAGVTIDGYTQSNASEAHDNIAASLKIVIDGNGHNCLIVESANNVIKGLDIRNCNCGVKIQTDDASDNVVTGNHIGTDGANYQAGVWIANGAHENTIGGDTVAERNVISNNTQYGVRIEDATTAFNTVSGNYIGTGLTALAGLGNHYSGVHILNGHDNTIGGATEAERNVIAGNGHHGVYIRGTSASYNVVTGNIIGAARDTLDGIPNALDGARIAEGAWHNTVGGSTEGERNVILANTESGVRIDGSGTHDNTVSGNEIGITAGDLPGLGNLHGVHITGGAYDNVVGGDTAGERNLISGNRGCGVLIEGSSTRGNTVSGNLIGTDTQGGRALYDLGNGEDGVLIRGQASQNTIGGTTAGERNVIADNTWSGVSIYGSGTVSNTVLGNYVGLNEAGDTAQGNALLGVFLGWGATGNVVGGDTAGERNVISGNDQDGVRIEHLGTDHNQVSGNYIGTDRLGTGALANAWHGVCITSTARYNTIGGSTAGEGNLISGNAGNGVRVGGSGTSRNVISGNRIGTDYLGTGALANAWDGVCITSTARYNTIGGSTAGEGNLISGNGENGVRVQGFATFGNVIWGNLIGTSADGASNLGNDQDGVLLAGGTHDNEVGGATSAERNVISGNFAGITLRDNDTAYNDITGNYIGLSSSGTITIPNRHVGVYMASGAHHNTVGGAASGERNVISGNTQYGILIFNGDANTVTGNYIGTDPSGSVALGNRYGGVEIAGDADDNVIGLGNLIAHNLREGVLVSGISADRDRITRNSIHSNGWSGIDLANAANDDIAAPVITGLTSSWPFAISGTACDGCTVEVFASATDDGEGEVYLDTAIATGGAFTLYVPAIPRPYLTATATDASKGTSEFSAVYEGFTCVYLPLVLRN